MKRQRKATVTILYDESQGNATQHVHVTLSKWETESSHHYVIEEHVVSPGSDVIQNEVRFDDEEDSQLIREAIDRFDQLLKNHPNLGKYYIGE